MKRGDVQAFERFYGRHREWVVSVALRFTGNREDALDVLQEAFTYFLRKLATFELRSRARTFLYPVVKHLALSRRRSAARTVSLDDARVEPTREAPEESTEGITALIDRLPEGQQEVVWLRFVDGLDLKEIAEALEIPLGTVKSRLNAALESLRERWKRG